MRFNMWRRLVCGFLLGSVITGCSNQGAHYDNPGGTGGTKNSPGVPAEQKGDAPRGNPQGNTGGSGTNTSNR